jgi:hypothetical protein
MEQGACWQPLLDQELQSRLLPASGLCKGVLKQAIRHQPAASHSLSESLSSLDSLQALKPFCFRAVTAVIVNYINTHLDMPCCVSTISDPPSVFTKLTRSDWRVARASACMHDPIQPHTYGNHMGLLLTQSAGQEPSR